MDLDVDMDDLDVDAAEDLEALADAGEARRPTRRRVPKGFRLFNVIRKTAFDYTFLAAGTNTAITLRRAIALPAHYFYWFGLRVHSKTISSGSFLFQFFDTLPSAQDPQEFTAASPYATISVLAAGTPPQLITTDDSFQAPYCKVRMQASQGSGIPPIALYGELSLVLLARAH
jgi:hypothetical protein